MSISHSNIANIQLPMFSRCIRSKGALLQSWRLVIQAGRDMSPTEACRVARIKNLQQCALRRPQVVCDTTAMSSWGQMSLQELASWETFWKCSTTEPVLCDFTQLDNLQAAVFQFEIVVTFEEVAVICERQAQRKQNIFLNCLCKQVKIYHVITAYIGI